MGISKRHHYLPVFYLKGFCNESGLLNVFNVQLERAIEKMVSPKSVFFENERNTLFLESGQTDFIEQLYSLIDNQCAPAFQKLRSLKTKEISTDILLNVKLFINTIFWRIPAFDGNIDNFIDGLSKDELKFSLKDKDGNEAPEDVFREILNDKDFRKAYRASLGLINYRIIKNDQVANWKFYFSTEQGFHITGDNPLIKRDNSKHPEDTEFIIPLGSNNLLVHNKKDRLQIIPPEIIVKVHLLILLQSSRYACSLNKGYLNFLNQIKKNFSQEQLRNEVFSIL